MKTKKLNVKGAREIVREDKFIDVIIARIKFDPAYCIKYYTH